MTINEHKVQKFIEGRKLLKPRQKVLVALSGGADSVCLLRMLISLGYECSAAHCNFHLRGEESNRDEHFVSELCMCMCVPLYKTDFDTEAYAHENGVSIEMAARDLRYDFFARVMVEHSIPTLAIGHHQGDNVETLMLNLTRGTGIRGLLGIQPKREMTIDSSYLNRYDVNDLVERWEVVRPLLCLTHDEITSSLRAMGQQWMEDSTNQHDDVGRNIVRLNILPEFLRVNPSAMQNIITTMENLYEVQKVYDNAVQKDIERCTVRDGVLSIPELMASVSPASVLHEWLSVKGYNRTQEHDILTAAKMGQSGKIIGEVLIDRQTLVLEASVRYVSAEDIVISRKPVSEVAIRRDARFAYLDAKKIQGELHVRLVQDADSFQPFGMKGRKLLSDFMTDQKLNVFEKRHQLVVTDSSDIVWVVGLRASEKYRVDKDTTEVVVLELKSDK